MTIRRIRLTQRREAAGFSQESLAKLLGVNRTTVQRWENGQSEPRQLHRPKLARALGVTRAELEQMIHVGNEPEPIASTLEVEHDDSLVVLEAGHEGGSEVQRRDFLQGLAATGVTAASRLVSIEQPSPLMGLRSAVDPLSVRVG